MFILAVLAAIAASTGGSAIDPNTYAAAEALARETPLSGLTAAEAFPASEAWAEAERRAARIPLPPGGRFSGIQWDSSGQPELTSGEIEQLLEYNALCQWVRARRRGVRAAQSVLETAAAWPALRSDPAIAAIIGETEPLASAALADCRASHRREMRYARARGLTPSR